MALDIGYDVGYGCAWRLDFRCAICQQAAVDLGEPLRPVMWVNGNGADGPSRALPRRLRMQGVWHRALSLRKLARADRQNGAITGGLRKPGVRAPASPIPLDTRDCQFESESNGVDCVRIVHKRENVVSYLAKRDQPTWRRKLQAAYAHPTYAEAKRALERLHRELRVVTESAAASLAEGLEEALTLHRLGVFPELGVSFKTTNLIESVMSRVEARTRRVTRWRTSDQRLRWCASALWAMERQFRRVKHYRQLPLLKQAVQRTLSRTTTAAA
jgi:hypothetical protein